MDFPDELTTIIQEDATISPTSPSSAETETSAPIEDHQIPAMGVCSRRISVPKLVDNVPTEDLAKTEEEDNKFANLFNRPAKMFNQH